MTADSRLQRLQLAVEVYVAWRQSETPIPAPDLLARHAELRDVLAPMLEAGDDEDPGSARRDMGLGPGAHLGDYQLLRELGRGGMGTVFEATQTSLGRRVALKVLHAELARIPRAVGRFRREARAVAGLRHPGILPIFEVAEAGGHHFFSMEYVDGDALDRRCDQEDLGLGNLAPTRPRAAAHVLAHVAEALEHAHQHGLVHRDIKPQNILLTADRRVQLLDFGLARERSAGAQAAHGIEGTPRYMSPEQRSGGAVGPASDLYSCGLVLGELLVRRRPYDHLRTAELLENPRHPLAAEAPITGLTGDLGTVCRRCLAQSAEARYATAGELGRDLRAFLERRPVAAASPLRRAALWMGRHRAATLALVLAIGATVATPVAIRLYGERTRAAVDAEDAALRATHQLVSTLRQRLARDENLDAGSNARLAAAAELCRQGLSRAEYDGRRRQQFGGAMLDLALLHRELGRPTPATELLDTLEAATAGRPAITDRVLRAQTASQRAAIAQQRSGAGLLGLTDAAQRRWDDILEQIPNHVPARQAKARLWLIEARRRFDDGERSDRVASALDEVVELRNRMGDLDELSAGEHSVLRGHLRFERRDFAGARTAFEAAAVSTDDVRPHSVAWVYRQLHEHRRRLLLARVDLAVGDRDRAATELIAVHDGLGAMHRRHPSDASVMRALAHACQSLGRTQLLRRNHPEAARRLAEACGHFEALTESDWIEPQHRDLLDLSLTRTLVASCNLLGPSPDPERARADYRAAIQVQRVLLAKTPEAANILSGLGASVGNLAAFENGYGQAAAARDHAVEAIDLQSRALARRPGSTTYRSFLAIHYAQLAYALAALDDDAGAIDAARTGVGHAPGRVNSARICSETCARIADAWTRAGREEEAHALRLEIVEWLTGLRNANTAGFESLLDRPAFDGLEGVAGFAALRDGDR